MVLIAVSLIFLTIRSIPLAGKLNPFSSPSSAGTQEEGLRGELYTVVRQVPLTLKELERTIGYPLPLPRYLPPNTELIGAYPFPQEGGRPLLWQIWYSTPQGKFALCLEDLTAQELSSSDIREKMSGRQFQMVTSDGFTAAVEYGSNEILTPSGREEPRPGLKNRLTWYLPYHIPEVAVPAPGEKAKPLRGLLLSLAGELPVEELLRIAKSVPPR